MKKFVFGILIICLLIGIPLIIMDKLASEKGIFKVPVGYEKIEIDLNKKSRDNEYVFSKSFDSPKFVDFFIQSDSEIENSLIISSDHKIIGKDSQEINYKVGKLIKNESMSSHLLLDKGKCTVSLTSKKSKGKIMIGYREKSIDASEYERLKKIDGGELDNPPEGYKKIYSVDLSGLSYKSNTIYTLALDRTQEIGLCIYTNSKKGNVSVDFGGEKTNYYGLIYSDYNSICDQMETTLGRGKYEIKLNSEGADGQLYVFIKD